MTTKNRVGERDGLGQALASFEDRIRQIQSLMPGVDGGGSVATPFKIGGYTFDEGGQIDLRRLVEASEPWRNYPVAVFQGVEIVQSEGSVSRAKLAGTTVTWMFTLAFSSAGTGGETITVTPPLPAAQNFSGGSALWQVGGSIVSNNPFIVNYVSTTSFDFYGGTAGPLGAANTIAANDFVKGTVTYETTA